ncbi:MAG: ATP-binding protein [Candidatus Sumerlaeota bacterium]|nr:ATP-binding protein [Candidatus Sumerlaeota bacterium]
MMSNPIERAFEALRQEGFEAMRRGDPARARTRFLKAAKQLFELAAQASGAARETRTRQAERMFAMARKIAPGSAVKPKAGGSNTHDGVRAKWLLLESPNMRFDDIAGLSETKETLLRRVIYPFQNPEVSARYKKKTGGGVLLYGPPGTGKTMLAKAVATEADAVFFSVRCSDIMSKWVGEAEKNLKELFETARAHKRSVVFLDEAEAIVAKRGGASTVMNRVIPEFLAQVDGIGAGEANLLLLGATNRPWDMDEAALRYGRFGELIYIAPPDAEARLAILEAQLSDIPCDQGIDLPALAARLEGYSGADIAGLVQKATDYPFQREIDSGSLSQLTNADIDAAICQSPTSLDKKMMARYEKFRLRSED